MGAETEVMWPQAKRSQEHQKPPGVPEATRTGKEGPSPEPSKGAWPADSLLPALVVRSPVGSNLSWQPRETNAGVQP